MENEENFVHPIRYIFCKNVRTIRRFKNISQEALALEAGVSRVYISGIESGKRAVSIDIMGKIADALKVNLVDLLQADYDIDNFIKKSNK